MPWIGEIGRCAVNGEVCRAHTICEAYARPGRVFGVAYDAVIPCD